MQFTGDISYSLYLMHSLGFRLCDHYLGDNSALPMPGYLRYGIGMMLAFAMGWLLYKLVEKPCYHYGKAITRTLK